MADKNVKLKSGTGDVLYPIVPLTNVDGLSAELGKKLDKSGGTVSGTTTFTGANVFVTADNALIVGDNTRATHANISYRTATKSYMLGVSSAGSFSLYRATSGSISTTAKHPWVYYPATDKHVFNSRVVINGLASEQMLVTRNIIGSEGDTNGTPSKLCLQYGNPHPIILGSTGSYNISADGGTYSGKALTAGNADTVNGHTVNADVPVDAEFTDTVYTHPTTAGNKHIPAGGSSGQILQWSSNGTASWVTVSNNLSQYPNTNIWRSNLGSPTVQEAAVIPEQMTNKFKFFPIDSISAETSTDGGTTWTATTLTTTQKKNLVCGNPNLTANINIAYTNQFRLVFAANNTVGYVFLNMLYIYGSTAGQNLKIKVEGQRNGSTTWTTLSAPSNTVNNWPGHCTLWHQYIRYGASTNTTLYCKVRVTFIPVQNGTYTNSITIYSMRWCGGYPSGKVEIFNWDYDKNVTFPGGLSAKSIDATKLSGIIPSACYSNTTYSVATTAANGLMAATDKVKLNSIDANANNYSHPTTHPMSMVEGLQTALDSKLTQTALESLLTLNSAGQVIAIAGHQIYGAPALVWRSFTLGGLLEVDGGGTKTYNLMANGTDYQSGSYIICSAMRAATAYGCPVSGANGAKWVILYGTSSKTMVYTGRTGDHCYDCTAWYEDDAGGPATAVITRKS